LAIKYDETRLEVHKWISTLGLKLH
jgi:hypothetical protein